ncbi:MAG TPA: hypothetical protein VFH29_03275 [Anaerolineales bacterium]|nr:hypothetical protein [Anaerolineales bacterium]
MNTRSFTLSVLIAGVVMALLGNLPLVNLVNCILCVWVWLSGALAVILYRRFQHGQAVVTAGQGAGLGAVAGVIGAVVGFGVFLLTSAVTTPIMEGLMRTLQAQGDLPPQMIDQGGTFGGALFFLLIDIALYPLFGALGGLITANMGNKSTTATPSAT